MKGKPSLAILIAERMKKKGKSEGEDSKWSEMAEELLAAIKDENPKELGKTLKHFIKACMNEYDSGDDEEY